MRYRSPQCPCCMSTRMEHQQPVFRYGARYLRTWSSATSSPRALAAGLAVFEFTLRHHGVEVVRRRDLSCPKSRGRELLHGLRLGLFVLAGLALVADTLIERELLVFEVPFHGAENGLAPTDTAVDNRAFHTPPPF